MATPNAVELKISPELFTFLQQASKIDYAPSCADLRLLGIDPGETTGMALQHGDHIRLWQMETKDIGPAFEQFRTYQENHEFNHVRYEDYRVYADKANQHKNMNLHTPKLIGAIEAWLHTDQVPNSKKMAAAAKGFWTDTKLQQFGMYHPGMKHARDALRHLLYYMCFPNQ